MHIDVYKRQEIVSAGTESVVEQGKNLLNADDYYAAYKQSDDSYLNNSSAVSYTHLDVYKRQDWSSYEKEIESILKKYSNVGISTNGYSNLLFAGTMQEQMCIRDRL